MGLTVFLIPAALALLALALVLLAQSVRQRRIGKLVSAIGIFSVLLTGCAVMMEFITRPL